MKCHNQLCPRKKEFDDIAGDGFSLFNTKSVLFGLVFIGQCLKFVLGFGYVMFIYAGNWSCEILAGNVYKQSLEFGDVFIVYVFAL
jgi:hypothetical protein